jgi:hypothetical protein
VIDSFRRVANRVLAMFRRAPLDADLGAEIADHIEAATQDNFRRGIPPGEARRQALARFGGVAQAVETHRETRGLPALDVLGQDLRFSFRTLRRDRSLASIVVAVLALGMGANMAVFSVVNTMLLRPLPFRDPGRMVWFAGNQGKGGLSDQTYTVAAFDVTSYQTFYDSIQYKLAGKAEPAPLVGVQVAGNFFPLLGVEPVLGRLFTKDECHQGGRAVVLLGHAFWERQFGGDPSIVGRTITIDSSSSDPRSRHHRRRPAGHFRFRRGILSGNAGGFLHARIHGFLAHLGEYRGGDRSIEARRLAGAGPSRN